MNEVEFVSQVTIWIGQICDRRLDLPFASASIEQKQKGKLKRRDFTLYDRDGRKVLTGEVKLPDKPDGLTPHNQTVVKDAHDKAQEAGTEYFFTWNVARLVLWKTHVEGVPLNQRDQKTYEVIDLRDSSKLDFEANQEQIKDFLLNFLIEYRDIYRGEKVIPARPLDERFIEMLDMALDGIVFHVTDKLRQKYDKDPAFRLSLLQWMVSQMGWTHSEETLDIDLERAAKTSCYRLVNKLMFYNALRRHFTALVPIEFRDMDLKDKSGQKLRRALDEYFREAMAASGDYETVYLNDFSDDLPFISPVGLSGWHALVQQIDAYDFTRLNYDVVGRVFEKLISPAERHRYGQHYTSSDLVDLINGFCIRKPDAIVIDPACGGGTFLVRAYARKKVLAARAGYDLTHTQQLRQLYGTDISPFAAHLALINLAARDLESTENYPLIAVDDFFNVRKGSNVFKVPARGSLSAESLDGKQQQIAIAIRQVDAVVGNPPYVRQEEIDRNFSVKSNPDQHYKEFLKSLFHEEWKMQPLSSRSDLYVHFWPHASHFLPEGGYIGLLTGSGWLDNDYGFDLQAFMLQRFQVIAILETEAEPWFTEARVNTAATILRRISDPAEQMNNSVKFVFLRKRLGELLLQTADEADRQRSVEQLVAEIESLTSNVNDDRWRVRVVSQKKLAVAGYEPDDKALAAYYKTHAASTNWRDDFYKQWDGDWSKFHSLKGKYEGTKWSIHLRAPDLFFELVDVFDKKLMPLRDIAHIRRGITSGADDFFYVEDITDQLASKELAEDYNLTRSQAKKIRVVKTGDGSIHLIESRFLHPLVFSVMELQGPKLDESALDKQLVLVSGSKKEIEGTHVLRYIRYGERQGYDQKATTSARTRGGADPREWYELADSVVDDSVLWPKAHQYRHIVAFNENNLPVNCRLYGVSAANETIDAKILGAVLNSTLVAWLKELYGRVLGREGNTDTMVFEVKQMLVPNPILFSAKTLQRLKAALDRLMLRPAMPIYPMGDELDQPDRIELDDAVLEGLGVIDPNERTNWRERIYAELKRLYKHKRELEEEAMGNRIKAARTKSVASARTVANELWQTLDRADFRLFPKDFVPAHVAVEKMRLPDGEIVVGDSLFSDSGSGVLGSGYIQIGEDLRFVNSIIRGEFVRLWQEARNVGEIQLPVDDDVCDKAIMSYRGYQAKINAHLLEWARSRTSDDKMQAQVVSLLWNHINEYLHGEQ